MSWFTEGFEAAEQAAQSGSRSKNHNFWTKPDEVAQVRFLTPAKDTFNIKRAFIPSARGQKYFTSPMVEPDPFLQAGYSLQTTFVWKVLDKRTVTFTDRANKEQSVGPRVLYFAVGQRDRKALQAFEAQMLADYNEELVEAGKPPVTIDDYNITAFDIKMQKAKSSPWMFSAVRRGKPTAISAEEREVIKETDFDLAEDLKPLSLDEIRQVLNQSPQEKQTSSSSESADYSYDTEPEEVPTFFGS